MSGKGFFAVVLLAAALAFSLIMPHPANAADQNVTLQIEGMT